MELLGLVNLLSITLVESMRIVRIVCIALLLASAIALIVLVLLQPSASEGMGAISGQSYDTFYEKNKGKSAEGIMKKLTIAFSIIVFVVSIVFFVTGVWFKF